jgi:transcriptional regulator with XRE-family HTH domain
VQEADADGRDRIGLKALGETIERLRSECGLTLAELGSAIERDADLVASIERGEEEPRWGTLRNISYSIDVELPELLEAAEERERELRKGGEADDDRRG